MKSNCFDEFLPDSGSKNKKGNLREKAGLSFENIVKNIILNFFSLFFYKKKNLPDDNSDRRITVPLRT